MVFLIADQLLIFDRVAQTITVLVNAFLDGAMDPAEVYEDAVGEIERLVSLLEQPSEHHPVSLPDEVPPVPFESNIAKEKFFANVLKAKESSWRATSSSGSARSGFSAPVKASPIDVYRAVRSVNPSPYMFLLELDGFSLVGASRKFTCVARMAGWKSAHCRHAAARQNGRRRRGAGKGIAGRPKERAEHVMLVDLARNDIGRVCDFGSVQVKELMVIERYKPRHAHRVGSGGEIVRRQNALRLMRATFPAGTVSGAPKIRAMQIISELEQATRGPYGGCVGYFSFNGNLDTCITIRTALLKDGKLMCRPAAAG